MSAWTDMASAHAARWEHGHTTLTNDCTLCIAEYETLLEATIALLDADPEATKEHP